MDPRRLVRLFASICAAAACAALPRVAHAGDADKPESTETTPATSTSSSTSDEPTTPPASGDAPKPAPAVKTTYDPSDVSEDPAKKYYFVGMRYRGNVVPKFIENMFVGEGATVYSNSVGLEVDIRKDGFSLIPALTYSEYGTGDILFLEHGKDANNVANYSFVNSSLKAVYATADLLWSTPLAKDVDFEYGLGVGIGVIFGDLQNNWLYRSATNSGQFTSSNGIPLQPCKTGDTSFGCNTGDHSGASVRKVGGYVEPSWAGGGSVPNVFPWISIPQFGLRFKPIKQMEARFGVGFSLTGFWFGLSADYGLERRPDTTASAKSGSGPSLHFN